MKGHTMTHYPNNFVDEGKRTYDAVRNTLPSIVQNYFDYLAKDRSIPAGERERIIALDAKVFLGLAQIYHSAPTLEYIKSIVTEEITKVKHKKVVKLQEEKKKAAPVISARKRNQIYNPVMPPKLEIKAKKPEKILLPSGVKSLDDVLKEISVDSELFGMIASATKIKVERVTRNGAFKEYISQSDYEKVKRYINEMRS